MIIGVIKLVIITIKIMKIILNDDDNNESNSINYNHILFMQNLGITLAELPLFARVNFIFIYIYIFSFALYLRLSSHFRVRTRDIPCAISTGSAWDALFFTAIRLYTSPETACWQPVVSNPMIILAQPCGVIFYIN
jgi:hypothetical protein